MHMRGWLSAKLVTGVQCVHCYPRPPRLSTTLKTWEREPGDKASWLTSTLLTERTM